MIKSTVVENGRLRGIAAADPRVVSYKGIPFAAPPVGKNRWRAPQPAPDWDGELPCLEFKPISMQAKVGVDPGNIYTREFHVDPTIEMDEDCLYLNVWTPAKADAERLPVYVWYFGGALQAGNTAEMEFDGERLARRGVVVVTVNYRVNVFGFLAHPGITAEAPGAPANFGHLDQRAGLQWVIRNIGAFGGDPRNITIGGQSAGGGSVMSHLTSPLNKGLFQKAIIQSGIFLRGEDDSLMQRRTLAGAEQYGIEFFKRLGVSTLEEARRIGAFELRDQADEFKGNWATVVDGMFCVGDPFRLFIENKRLMCPVLFGHTANEFLSPGPEPVNGFEHAIRIAGEASARTGANALFYYYNFDPEIPGWDNPGSFHSSELWFVFETLAKCWRPFVGKHYDLARLMCNYWANFIKSGDPNGVDANGGPMPEWKPFTQGGPYGMMFADAAVCMERKPSEHMEGLVREYFEKNPVGQAL